MATRSFIAKEVDGGFVGIYCHWDGYPEHNGKILAEHYTSSTKVTDLIALGDLSILGPELGDETTHESFSNPTDGYCLAYHRDRGEKYNAPSFEPTIGRLQTAARAAGCEFLYVWQRSGKWARYDIDFY